MLLSRYLIYFIIYSFLGWVYESLFYSFQFKRPVNTGFLKGCFCPIYGVACVFNLIAFGNITSNTAIFILSAVVISSIEYVVSYLLEYLFDKRWWDYSEWPANINGRVGLFSSIAFGIMSLLQIRFIQPYVERIVNSMPERMELAFVSLSAMLILVDLLFTIRSMDKADEKLWFINEETEHMQKVNEILSERKKDISNRCSDVKNKIKSKMSR